MKLTLEHFGRALIVGTLSFLCLPAMGQEIWTGPPISFTKTPGGDPLDPAKQDRITSNVWLTRADTRGIFNAAQESFYTNFSSPVDTEWAVGTTADIGSLVFDTWEGIVGLGTPINGPPSSVGVDMVLHLITDDVYLDLTFTDWGQGFSAGGAFSYLRSTPAIPEPSALALLVMALGLGATGRLARLVT